MYEIIVFMDNIFHTYFVHDPSLQFDDIFHTYFVHDPLPAILVTIASSTGVQALAVGTSVFHYSYRAETFLTRIVFFKASPEQVLARALVLLRTIILIGDICAIGETVTEPLPEQLIFDDG